MNSVLKKFKVIPSVVEADKESEITIKSLEGTFRFFDDTIYKITFIPQDVSDVAMDEEISLKGYDKSRNVFSVKPENGELKVKYFFSGEQEWRIRVSSDEYEKHQNHLYSKYKKFWTSLIDAPKTGVDLRIYSLKSDLYERRVMKGDLHLHTTESDGQESPERVAALCRKIGHDFIALTDHNVYNSSAVAKKKFDFIKSFEIMCGEEVHNGYAGFFHMINIGSRYSVNDIYVNEPERVKNEVAELENDTQVPGGIDKREYLNRVWLYREIKKSGGYAIFPHPYWYIGHSHVSTLMSKTIINDRLCDAFEVLGGCTPRENNLQVALYNELRAEGCSVPIVGSTDSHSLLSEEYPNHSTLVFVNEGDVLQSVSDGYSVAIESLPGENVRVYGKLRLASYAHFLLENYFPLHNELCSVSGLLMERFLNGDTTAKRFIMKNEEKVLDFEEEFFGSRYEVVWQE